MDTLTAREIARVLTGRITEDGYEGHPLMPNHRVIAGEFGVHPSTAYRAYRILAEEGRVHGKAGVGTIVGPPKPTYAELEAKVAGLEQQLRKVMGVMG